ncbi:nitrate- and nitrite sensing domain-containing protein [Spirillospora sp. NPDC048911]|uniref:nitrate- and nitrite sensing domain-containing protein n=1 Tax=Spirillospora sp. NPDC048911 TaxID=3364527 RepID=UPI00371B4C7B
MTRRAHSIQTKIIILLIAPITALVALWAYAATVTLRDSLRLVRAETFDSKVVTPTTELIAALQDERRMSVAHLGDDATIGRAGLDAQRAKTNRVAAVFRASAKDGDVRGATTDAAWRQMGTVVRLLEQLEGLRTSVDKEDIDRPQALGRFNELIDQASVIFDEVYPDDRELVRDARVLVALDRARENLAREDALVTGALAAGKLAEVEYLQFMRTAGAQRFMFEEAARSLPAAAQVRYRQIVTGKENARFRDLEDRMMQLGRTGKRPPVDVGAWRTATESVSAQLAALTSDLRARNTQQAKDQATGVLIRLSLAGGLGLLAIAISIVVAFRVGRRLIRESRSVAASMHAFTSERLPRISELARTGQEVTDDAPATEFTISEINQIDGAFTEARRAVVRAGASEAMAHQRLGEILINLARRNQALLQRLLGMLETMQRHVEDPDQLERLYELDHVATRMRRHAEGLVILSGRPAGRTWRRPVRLIDVARAATAEVEDYTRVEVLNMPRLAIHGRAVADVIHLLAELIENALSFSPSETMVRVTGQPAAHGFVFEIEDRGLGIPPETLAEINERLRKPSALDFQDSARLGFSVVTRLAERHDIKVTLRGSPYGGVMAIVLIPGNLLAETTAGALPEGAQPDDPPIAMPPPATTTATVVAHPATLGTAPPEGSAAPMPALPSRQRQAHLAPQLRREAKAKAEAKAAAQAKAAQAAYGDTPPPAGGVAPPPSPERTRSLMTAMQQGWQRGRAEPTPDNDRDGTADDE